MIDGVYHNPTKIFFGKAMEDHVGEEVAKYSKNILLHYGGDRFKRYGLYERVAEFQTACGIVDAISHVLERYFTNTPYVDVTDQIGEGLIRTLRKYAHLVKQQPQNYDIRAEIMWACKFAHDNTAGFHNLFPFLKIETLKCINLDRLRCPD